MTSVLRLPILLLAALPGCVPSGTGDESCVAGDSTPLCASLEPFTEPPGEPLGAVAFPVRSISTVPECDLRSSGGHLFPIRSQDDWVTFHGERRADCEYRDEELAIQELLDYLPDDHSLLYGSFLSNACGSGLELRDAYLDGSKLYGWVILHPASPPGSCRPPCACVNELAIAVEVPTQEYETTETWLNQTNAECVALNRTEAGIIGYPCTGAAR